MNSETARTDQSQKNSKQEKGLRKAKGSTRSWYIANVNHGSSLLGLKFWMVTESFWLLEADENPRI